MNADIQDSITPKLQQFIDKLPNATEIALEAGMQLIRTQVLAEVPIDTGNLYESIAGNTRDSIFEVHKNEKPMFGYIGTKSDANSGTPYALRVEFGFFGADSLGRNYSQQGQFFFSIGLSHAEQSLTETMSDVLSYQLGL